MHGRENGGSARVNVKKAVVVLLWDVKMAVVQT